MIIKCKENRKNIEHHHDVGEEEKEKKNDREREREGETETRKSNRKLIKEIKKEKKLSFGLNNYKCPCIFSIQIYG